MFHGTLGTRLTPGFWWCGMDDGVKNPENEKVS